MQTQELDPSMSQSLGRSTSRLIRRAFNFPQASWLGTSITRLRSALGWVVISLFLQRFLIEPSIHTRLYSRSRCLMCYTQVLVQGCGGVLPRRPCR